ncbi:hypothetical protein MBANPS3_007091 [Mucor bainieri]
MQTRSQTREKNATPDPTATQKAMQLSFHHLKIEPCLPTVSSGSDIKQEHILNTKAKNEPAAVSVNESFVKAGAVVKMEPTDISLKQQIESKSVPDLRDGAYYYYSCRSCNQTRATLRSLLDHRKEAHSINIRKNCPIKHLTLEPDIDDVNHYCRTCEKHFSARQYYKQHLTSTHHMIITPSSKQPEQMHARQQDDKLINALSSISKFNHYCKPCQRFYCFQSSYDMHVLVAHSAPSALQSSTTTQLAAGTAHQPANRYCLMCNKTISKDYFKLHTTLLHATHEPITKKKSILLQPNVNDPNHYCSMCQQKFDSKSKYHDHLQDAHNMALRCLVPKDPGFLPNPQNPHNYCRVCKKTMVSRAIYRSHCKYSHFMVLKPPSKSKFKSRFAR